MARKPYKYHYIYKTVNEETKEKISLSQQGKHKGKNNSQYGKMWIYNEQTKESKTILKTESIPEGWKKGRKINHNSIGRV